MITSNATTIGSIESKKMPPTAEDALCRPHFVTFLLVCLVVKLLLVTAVFSSGFLGFGGDDSAKMLIAVKWADAPSFAPDQIWLPTQFWMLGSIYKLTNDVYLASILLNCFWSIATALMVYLIARFLFGELVARVSLVVLICWPWNIWTAVSPQGEAMFQCIFLVVLYGLLRWQRDANPRWLMFAASACAILTMTRYHGWIVALMVLGYLTLLYVFRTPVRPSLKQILITASLMLAFPIAWFAYNGVVYGDVMHWRPAKPANAAELSFWVAGVRFLVYVAMVAPMLIPFLLLGIGKLRRLPTNERYPCLLLSYGYLFALVAYGATSGGLSRYVEQRYVVPVVLAALPMAVCFLCELRVTLRWRVLLVSFICLWGVASSFRVTRQQAQDTIVAEHLQELWEKGVLPETTDVFVHSRSGIYKGYRSNQDAIGILARRPGHVLGLANPVNDAFETAIDQSNAATEEFLAQHQIALVLTDSRNAIDRLASVWNYGGSLSGFKLFYGPTQLRKPWMAPTNQWSGRTPRGHWENGIELLDMTLAGSAAPEFPNFLIPSWKVPRNGDPPYQGSLRFDPVYADSDPFTVTFQIGNGCLALENGDANIVISDRVNILDAATATLPGRDGRFQVSLTLHNADGTILPISDANAGEPSLNLGEVLLITGKERIISEALKGKSTDWRLVGRVLLSLFN